MENLTNIPGLQHIAEEIFLNLDNESLVNCFKVNRLWKNILNSSFWMKKCEMYKPKGGRLGESTPAYVSFRSLITWTKVVEVTPNNTILEEELAKKLKKIHKCLENADSKKYSLEDCPIHWAAYYGHVDAIKVLISLFNKNANNPNEFGMTPIHMAAINGHAAVIKLLIPNIDYDEEYCTGGNRQWSPIYYAAMNGHINVIKILAPLTKYLNYKEPFSNGQETPDEVAARFNDYETSRKITNILKMQYVP